MNAYADHRFGGHGRYGCLAGRRVGARRPSQLGGLAAVVLRGPYFPPEVKRAILVTHALVLLPKYQPTTCPLEGKWSAVGPDEWRLI